MPECAFVLGLVGMGDADWVTVHQPGRIDSWFEYPTSQEKYLNCGNRFWSHQQEDTDRNQWDLVLPSENK